MVGNRHGDVRRRTRWGVALGAVAIVASGVAGTGSPAGAANPGINGVIACASNRTGNFEIFTFGPNGTEVNPTNITNAPTSSESNPSWRSDGRKIAFDSNRSGASEIYIADADGSNVQRVTFSGVPGVHGNSAPSWHPDGSQLAYQSTRPGSFQVFKINVDGTGDTQLTFGTVENSLPAWSPDGTLIAYSSRRIDPAADVHIMNPDGTGDFNLTNSIGTEDSWPSWSPDGTQIAFHSRFHDPAGEEIYKINLNGTGRTRLTVNINPNANLSFDIFPFWSPDGTRIGWNSGRDGPNFGEVYHMSAVTGDQTDIVRVTNNTAIEQRCDWQPLCTHYGSGRIVGTPGNDIICGSEGPDQMVGGGGNDVMYGYGGGDLIVGEAGDDMLFGGLGGDSVNGGAGFDFLSGGPGTDGIYAEPGERIDTGAGPDQCFGRATPGCPPRIS